MKDLEYRCVFVNRKKMIKIPYSLICHGFFCLHSTCMYDEILAERAKSHVTTYILFTNNLFWFFHT